MLVKKIKKSIQDIDLNSGVEDETCSSIGSLTDIEMPEEGDKTQN